MEYVFQESYCAVTIWSIIHLAKGVSIQTWGDSQLFHQFFSQYTAKRMSERVGCHLIVCQAAGGTSLTRSPTSGKFATRAAIAPSPASRVAATTPTAALPNGTSSSVVT